ncbi:MAG: sensor histidine kinase [Candidatus Thorarchaeota archaeon]
MSKSRSRTELHPFTVDNLLVEEMGQRLVGRDSTAIIELVKNSFDADATEVSVVFLDVTNSRGSIIVEDNGRGMPMDRILNGWMRIGTHDKVREQTSKDYGRPITGSKGIGRFACQRVANVLELVTVSGSAKRRKTRISCAIDWNRFKPGDSLSDIKIEFHVEESLPINTNTGTKLTLRNLRNKWTPDIFEDVINEISSFVKPVPWLPYRIGSAEERSDPGMNVIIEAPEFGITGFLEPEFLKASWGILEGHIDESGTASYLIKSRHLPKSKNKQFQSEIDFSEVGPVSLKVYFFVLKKSILGDFSRTKASRISREHAGIRIFYDGFRIPPYGDSQNDWLGLDEFKAGARTAVDSELKQFLVEGQKRPMLSRPRNSQVFGFVEVSRLKNPNITVSMSRDHIEENGAFNKLKLFVQRGIDFLALQYASTSPITRRPRKSAFKPLATAEKKAETIKKEIRKDLGLSQETLTQVDKRVDSLKTSIRNAGANLRRKLAMYHVIASTGLTTGVYIHDLREFLRPLGTALVKLESRIEKEEDSDLVELIHESVIWYNTVSQQSQLIGLMMGKSSREKRRPVNILAVTREVFKGFESYMTELSISPANDCTPGLKTPPMYPGEVYSIILNLTTNAIKAVQRAKEERKIRVYTKQIDDYFTIEFMDNGKGIKKKDRESVFEPFETGFDSDLDFALGTGLGLPLIRDILVEYEGTIEFVDPEDGWKTCALIKIPKGVQEHV